MSLNNRLAAVLKKTTTDTAADVAEANKRWARRKPASTPAKILFDGITTPYECVLKDISSTGAQIEMTSTRYNPDASTEIVPHYFTLIIPLDRTSVDCQSMWRRGSKIGARFVGMVRAMPALKRPAVRKPPGK